MSASRKWARVKKLGVDITIYEKLSVMKLGKATLKRFMKENGDVCQCSLLAS